MGMLLWVYLARKMPLRYFMSLCLLTVGIVTAELTLRKTLAKRIAENPYLKILLELILGFIFVISLYLFGLYIYPGSK